MTTTDSRAWAYFIVDKLGLPYTKSSIIRFAENSSHVEVWNRFISCNALYLNAAKANLINNPDDVARYFREAGYASMRSTFPSKARGRRVIGPRIVPLQKLIESNVLTIKGKNEYENEKPIIDKPQTIPITSDIVGKRIEHISPHLSFGAGIVLSIKDNNIIVEFDNGEIKTLSYTWCVSHHYIKIL